MSRRTTTRVGTGELVRMPGNKLDMVARNALRSARTRFNSPSRALPATVRSGVTICRQDELSVVAFVGFGSCPARNIGVQGPATSRPIAIHGQHRANDNETAGM